MHRQKSALLVTVYEEHRDKETNNFQTWERWGGMDSGGLDVWRGSCVPKGRHECLGFKAESNAQVACVQCLQSKHGLGLLTFALWAYNKGWIWVASGTVHSWVKDRTRSWSCCERSLRVRAPGETLGFHPLSSSFHTSNLTTMAPHFHPRVMRAVYMWLLACDMFP